jgi:AraC family transcriptional regulator of adaptative response/methylated-DNA-[protein]-cysteine methyltransferase
MVTLADSDKPLIAALHEEFPQANILPDDKFMLNHTNSLLKYLQGKDPHCSLPLDMQGTAFQKRVWKELTKITYGTTRTYEQIAQRIGKPKAIRAVANACANNPTSLVVPCHRVIRKDGSLGGYRWDLKRKQALLKMEKDNLQPHQNS